KGFGQNLDTMAAVSEKVKAALEGMPGVSDLVVEPITGGKYLSINIKREELARYGLNVDDVNQVIESALGGATVGNTIEGRQRFSISVRLAQEYRNCVDRIQRIPIHSPAFRDIPL